MTSINYSITMVSQSKEELSALASKTGGWMDTSVFHMESKPRLTMFKKAAKELKLEIKEIEEAKYSDYGDEIYSKIIYPKQASYY